MKKQNVVSAELLKNTLAKRAVIPTKLLQMGERERERLLARSKEINSTSTYRHSGYYQKYLKEYLTSLGKEDIEFTDITEDFGNSYKAFLKRYKNFSPSQTNKCLCWLSKLVYLAWTTRYSAPIRWRTWNTRKSLHRSTGTSAVRN